jgi:HK97 family phage portal protein
MPDQSDQPEQQLTIWGRTKSVFKSLLGVSGEGAWRGPFLGMSEQHNWFQIERLGDGWQRNLQIDKHAARHVEVVYGCTMAYGRSISQCYPQHVRKTGNKVEKVTTSAAYRVLNNPNSYQTAPLFLLNLITTLLFEGEAFAIGIRNNRGEITAIHPLMNRGCRPYIADDGSVFYQINTSDNLLGFQPEFLVPARDILHLRYHTPRHPLIGESPITAAMLAIGVNVALSASQNAFFSQMNRPSGILSTDQSLTKEQMNKLRVAFDEQSKVWAQGGMPIMANGLKFAPVAITSQDAQLIEAQKMSVESICRVFGVPPQLVAVAQTGGGGNAAEALIQTFLSMGLGSYLEHVERAFDDLFGLGTNEYIEFDTSSLIRTDYAGRIDAAAKGIQGGVFTPNEARAMEGLGPVPGGDDAFLQKQMVPVSIITQLAQADLKNTLNPPKPPPAPVPVDPDAATEGTEDNKPPKAANDTEDVSPQQAKDWMKKYLTVRNHM